MVEFSPKLLHFTKLHSLLHFLPEPCNIFTQIYLPYLWHFAILQKGFPWGYLPASLPSFKGNILLWFKNTSPSVKTYLVENVAEFSSLWRGRSRLIFTFLDLPSIFSSSVFVQGLQCILMRKKANLHAFQKNKKGKQAWKTVVDVLYLHVGEWKVLQIFCPGSAVSAFSRRIVSLQRQKEITSSTLHFLPSLYLWVSGKLFETQNYVYFCFNSADR